MVALNHAAFNFGRPIPAWVNEPHAKATVYPKLIVEGLEVSDIEAVVTVYRDCDRIQIGAMEVVGFVGRDRRTREVEQSERGYSVTMDHYLADAIVAECGDPKTEKKLEEALAEVEREWMR